MPRAKQNAPRPNRQVAAGRKIFGDDWISNLTDPERALAEKYGPRTVNNYGAFVEIIDPCPAAKRQELDRVLGRHRRLLAQRNTVDEWLKTIPGDAYDPTVLDAALAKLGPATRPTMPGRGRRATLGPEVERALRNMDREELISTSARKQVRLWKNLGRQYAQQGAHDRGRKCPRIRGQRETRTKRG